MELKNIQSTWESLVNECINLKVSFIVEISKFEPFSDHEKELFNNMHLIKDKLNDYMYSDECDNYDDVDIELNAIDDSYKSYLSHTWLK
jgi:hypothetical protein